MEAKVSEYPSRVEFSTYLYATTKNFRKKLELAKNSSKYIIKGALSPRLARKDLRKSESFSSFDSKNTGTYLTVHVSLATLINMTFVNKYFFKLRVHPIPWTSQLLIRQLTEKTKLQIRGLQLPLKCNKLGRKWLRMKLQFGSIVKPELSFRLCLPSTIYSTGDMSTCCKIKVLLLCHAIESLKS